MFDFGVDASELLALKSGLSMLPLHIQKEVHIKALRKAARPIFDDLDYSTPYEFGDLVSDLAIRKSKFQDVNAHSVIVGYKSGTGHVGYIGRFLEDGTVHIKAMGFMKKAYEKHKVEVERIYTEVIQEEVDKLLKGK